jgi:alkane 1-monooxygenase
MVSITTWLLWARHGLSNVLLLLTVGGVFEGGWLVYAAALTIIAIPIADEAIGDKPSSTPTAGGRFCDLNLYAAGPVLCCLAIAHAEAAGKLSSNSTVLSLSASVEFGLATFLVSYQYALIGATVGHELVHRATSRAAIAVSSMLLAFTLNAGFSVFHGSGHHRIVGFWQDPATARRDESFIAFLARTVAGQWRMAFWFEADRLRRRNRSAMSLHNRLFVGQLYSIAIAAIMFLVGGSTAATAFIVAGAIGRCLHELVNYIQHFGLVRAPGQPVTARHSWDCGRLLSNALQYNLPRHSMHHIAGGRPFRQLAGLTNAPTLPHGYQVMAAMALVPPLWHRMMTPRLQEWDSCFASDRERAIIDERDATRPKGAAVGLARRHVAGDREERHRIERSGGERDRQIGRARAAPSRGSEPR